MIRNIVERSVANLMYIEAYGLSTDDKPVDGIITGSKFIAVDTGVEFRFDEVSGTWSAMNTGNGKTSIANAVVTLGSALTYTGNEQTQAVSSVNVGSTTLTANTDYEVTDNKATNAGDYTLKVVGKGSYAGGVAKDFSVAKADGSLTPTDDSMELVVGTDGDNVITVVGDGELSVAVDDTATATAIVTTENNVTTLTVTPVAAGSATVTITMADSGNYNGATATVAVTVTEE